MDPDGLATAGFLETWVGLVRRRWGWGVGVFGVVMALAALVLLAARPTYRAEARLRLGDPPPQNGVVPSGGFFGLFGLGGNPFANDLELLSSRTLAERVVADGSLNVKIDAPRHWHRDSLLVSMVATPLTEEATFEVEWTRDGRLEVRQTAPAYNAGMVTTSAPGSSVSFGGVSAAFREWREGAPREIVVKTLPFDEAVRRQRARLRSERTRREANVVGISYDDTDPGVALLVAHSIVERFMEMRARMQARETGQTMDSLRTVADQTARQLADAEAALEAFERRSGLVAIDAQSEALVERYSAALSGMETAETDLAGIEEVLERAADATNPVEAWAGLVSHPRLLQNETVGNLLTQLTRLEEERAEMASRRTRESREHRVLIEQITYLESSLQSMAENYRRSLVELVANLQKRVDEMEERLARLPEDAIELGRRQRDVRILNEVVLLTEQRIRQEELRQALTFANVQVIDPAKLGSRPIWPRKKLGLAVGFLIASIFGLLALVVAERADVSVRTEAEIRRLMGVPVLAALHLDRAGRVVVGREEADTLIGKAEMNEWGTARLVLAEVGSEAWAEAVAAALRRREADRDEADRQSGTGVPTLEVTASLDRFSAAAAAAKGASPVVAVLRQGRADEARVARAHSYLSEAGANLVGVVVVCASAKAARAVWA